MTIQSTKDAVGALISNLDGGEVKFMTPNFAMVVMRLADEPGCVDICIGADDDIENSYYFDAADLRKTAKLFKRLADMLDGGL